MTTPTVTPRDPVTQFWAQSVRPELEGRLGTTFALSNGTLGLRGCHEEMPAWGRPEFYIAGTYAGGPPSLLGFHDPDHILTHPERITPEILHGLADNAISTLPNFPNPLALRLTVGGEPFSHERTRVLSNERLLEFDRALLRRRLVFRDAAGRRTCVDSRRFLSFADRNLICLQYKVTPLDHDSAVEITPYIKQDVTNPNGVVLWSKVGERNGPMLSAIECVTNDTQIHVAIAQKAVPSRQGNATVMELFVVAGVIQEQPSSRGWHGEASMSAGGGHAPPCWASEDAGGTPATLAGKMPASLEDAGILSLDAAVARAEAAAARGFDAHLAEHTAAYRAEAQAAAVDFDGDADTRQGFHFGQLHLHMNFCYGDNRVGMPIKGLTGHGYRFLNFWDIDFHMFPYYLMTKPRQARLLLEYRYNQLDAYRANARRWGAAGAQVPWETQVDGKEETAPWLCLQDREIHISADAAWMFKLYHELADDGAAMAEMGAEFILETARFYASRMRYVPQRGRWELPGIGCPDQYHTFADNNVFISMMARWNLRYAVGLAEDGRYARAAAKVKSTAEEVGRWKEILGNFYVIGPNADGIIEEFDGFFGLSTDLDGICETFCRHSQAVKQPDVVAAFGPFEDEFPLDMRRKNWRFYADRTLHGSSLSLPGMAYAAARCGLNDEALYNLHKSARMDLDDVNMDSDRGVHLSGYAVQWYAVALGFGGLTARPDCLRFAPNLPRQWRWLEFAVHWKFQRLAVRLTPGEIAFTADAGNDKPVAVRLLDGPMTLISPGKTVSMRF